MPVAPELEGLQNRLKSMASKYAACVTQITEAKDQELLDLLCTPPRRNGSSHHHGSPDGTGRFKERSVL